MAILFRIFLFAVLIYLIVKMIREFMSGPKDDDDNIKTSKEGRKVRKDAGEYVDYEEVKGEGKRKG